MTDGSNTLNLTCWPGAGPMDAETYVKDKSTSVMFTLRRIKKYIGNITNYL